MSHLTGLGAPPAKTLVVALAVLAMAGPAMANEKMSEHEQKVYRYGFELGVAASVCAHYELGSLSRQDAHDMFDRLDESNTIEASSKKAIYNSLVAMRSSAEKCKAVIRSRRPAVQPAFSMNGDVY